MLKDEQKPSRKAFLIFKHVFKHFKGIFENQLLPAKAILIFILKRKQEYETGLTRLTQDSLKC